MIDISQMLRRVDFRQSSHFELKSNCWKLSSCYTGTFIMIFQTEQMYLVKWKPKKPKVWNWKSCKNGLLSLCLCPAQLGSATRMLHLCLSLSQTISSSTPHVLVVPSQITSIQLFIDLPPFLDFLLFLCHLSSRLSRC